MNDEQKAAYVSYRLDRAADTIKEARMLFEAERMFGAVNRIYYAMFYAVSALACSRGFSTSSHSQLRGYFNREFIKKGIIPTDLGQSYGVAFDSRKKGDYDDLVEFEKEQVLCMLIEAEHFVEVIGSLSAA